MAEKGGMATHRINLKIPKIKELKKTFLLLSSRAAVLCQNNGDELFIASPFSWRESGAQRWYGKRNEEKSMREQRMERGECGKCSKGITLCFYEGCDKMITIVLKLLLGHDNLIHWDNNNNGNIDYL